MSTRQRVKRFAATSSVLWAASSFATWVIYVALRIGQSGSANEHIAAAITVGLLLPSLLIGAVVAWGDL